jgi:hypothetical protein
MSDFEEGYYAPPPPPAFDPNAYQNPYGNYDPRMDPGVPPTGQQYGGGGYVPMAPGGGGSAGGGYLDAAGRFVSALAPAAGQLAQGYFQNQAGNRNAQAATDQTNRIIADQQHTEQYNRPNVSTPWSNTQWTTGPDGRQTQTTTLNPADQSNLDAYRGVTAARLGAAGGIDLSLYKKMPDFESIGLGALAHAAGLDPNGKSNFANPSMGGSMIAGNTQQPYISPASPEAMRNNIGLTLDSQGRIIRG